MAAELRAASAPRGRRLLRVAAAAAPWLGAGGRLLRNLSRLPGAALRVLLAARLRREWLLLRVDRGLLESPPAHRWFGLPQRRGAPVLAGVLEGLRAAQVDARVRGVLVRVGRGPLGWAQAQTLARALDELRSHGKRVVVYGSASGNAGAWLGAGADAFWLAPGGALDLVGVRLGGPHLRAALDWLRVRPRVISAGRYKSAGELLERRELSEAAREALEAVADDLYAALVGALAAGRARSADNARAWIDQGPFLAVQAQDLGLIDAQVFPDEIPARLAALAAPAGSETIAAGGSADEELGAALCGLERYRQLMRPRLCWEPLARPGARLALVALEGLITEARVRPLLRALARLREDESTRAVVLRIDSPGGSPQASELLWRALRRLGEKKPVVASLGNVAASGGYYAAVACHELVAEPTTLTGSIGVVLLSLELGEALEELGIRFDGVQRGRNAGIHEPWRAHSEEQHELLRRQIELLYRDFVGKVAQGRGRTAEQIEPVAQGRVWSGAAAHGAGLVDTLGGLDTALARARARAGLGPDEGVLLEVSLAQSPWQQWADRPPADSPLDELRGALYWCPIHSPLR
jgi:protease-4